MFARGTHASQPHIPIVCSLSPNDKNLHAEMNELKVKSGVEMRISTGLWRLQEQLCLGLGAFNPGILHA